jgi:hypothetical protein
MAPKTARRGLSKWMAFDPREKGPFGRFLEKMRANEQFPQNDLEDGDTSLCLPTHGLEDHWYVTRFRGTLNTTTNGITVTAELNSNRLGLGTFPVSN